MEGLVRVAAAVPKLALGNVKENTKRILTMLEKAAQDHVSLVVFPETCLSGYTCGDLFYQHSLLNAVTDALAELVRLCPSDVIAAVGAPIQCGADLYNCAVVFQKDQILGVVPKTFLPNQNEFYEKRWFHTGDGIEEIITLAGQEVLFSKQQLFASADGVCFGVELCEDLWTPLPPSTLQSLAGAEIILNLSASNELIAKREYRKDLVRQQSARCLCAYVYTSAGQGESTSDLVFSGHSMIASSGSILKENQQYLDDDYLIYADVDIDRLRSDRMKQQSFGDCARVYGESFEVIPSDVNLLLADQIETNLHVSKHPFIPSDAGDRRQRCSQIFDMQANALARRLSITGGKLVVGISGGLDSTLALLAACRAMDLMGLPRTNILGITMPCFGTTDRTYQNSLTLMTTLGTAQREIPIHESVRLHFRDIGHDESDHSVTYENCQARERTQILMDVANKTGGIVLGTGDLSEIALGWCTYNADHMSMYGVNSGVPKTLVRWIVQTVSDDPAFSDSREVLLNILDTPISPELLPPDEKGNIAQQTEDLVGPYALHDFFLYYVVRFGYRPEKIYQLCCDAFRNDFDKATILKWLKNFYRRFFNQQFKRNCMPDGVKIGSIALSPRGDWRMPSDAQAKLWLEECEALS